VLLSASVCAMSCYFLAPGDKRQHTAHAHQQAASQASMDSAWTHPVWLPHSTLGFQRPVGRSSYRLTTQSTIARSASVACNNNNSICNAPGASVTDPEARRTLRNITVQVDCKSNVKQMCL